MSRRQFSLGALGALGVLGIGRRAFAAPDSAPAGTSIDRIRRWVVVMLENRSFDSLHGKADVSGIARAD